MTDSWTTEQILSLALDERLARAGLELAMAGKWRALGHTREAGSSETGGYEAGDIGAVWGECQGSAAQPYRTQVHPVIPAFGCTCPSRKRPCKHALGLFLLYAREPNLFAHAIPPGWVKAPEKAPATESSAGKKKKTADPRARAKRAAQREARIQEGLSALELWLCDLMRQGLAEAQRQPRSYWEGQASRLVDVQAPGLARKVRELGAVVTSGAGWEARLLAEIARLHLLVESYRKIEDLPEDVQADVRQEVGWTVSQEDLREAPGVRDCWVVMGQRRSEESMGAQGKTPALKTRRTWLWGRESGRWALELAFAGPGQRLEERWLAGSQVEAELVYFPGVQPLRVVEKQRLGRPVPLCDFPVVAGWAEAYSAHSQYLAANPWQRTLPAAIGGLLPVQEPGGWTLQDSQGRAVPLVGDSQTGWKLLAVSGGTRLAIFGELTAGQFLPVSVWSGARLVNL